MAEGIPERKPGSKRKISERNNESFKRRHGPGTFRESKEWGDNDTSDPGIANDDDEGFAKARRTSSPVFFSFIICHTEGQHDKFS